jgi:tetratricopeptide (TPR) repeat protein
MNNELPSDRSHENAPNELPGQTPEIEKNVQDARKTILGSVQGSALSGTFTGPVQAGNGTQLNVKGIHTSEGNVIISGRDTIIQNEQNLRPLPTAFDPPEPFINRHALIQEIMELIRRGSPVVVLQGMGGVGKNATAREIIAQIKHLFPAGVFYGSLSTTPDDPASILRLWGNLCTSDLFEENFYNLIFRIKALLEARIKQAGGRLIILLEDVRKGQEEIVKSLLAAAPSNTPVLITTQDASIHHARAEYFRLEPLTPDDSIEFIKLIARLDDDAPKDALRALADITGYLPLALRVSGHQLAGKVRILRIKDELSNEILAEIIQKLCKKIKDQAAPELEATFFAVYKSLSPIQQALLQHLSVLEPSPFVEDKIGSMLPDFKDLRDLLDELLDISMLGWERQTKAYILHPLHRQFAQAQLDDQKKMGIHFSYYQHYDQLAKSSQAVSHPERETDRLLIRAHHHAVEAGRVDLAASILLEHGLPDRLIRRGEKALLIQLCNSTFKKIPGGVSRDEYLTKDAAYKGLTFETFEPKQRARFYRQLGVCAAESSDFSEALKFYRIAELLLGDSDPREQIRLYRDMAVAQARTGDSLDQAVKNCEWALLRLVDYSDKLKQYDEANLYISLGLLLEQQGNFSSAYQDHKVAFRIFRGLGLIMRAFEAYDNMGVMLQNRNHYGFALHLHQKAFEYFKGQKHTLGIAQTRLNVGACFHALGQQEMKKGNSEIAHSYYKDASGYYEESRQSFIEINDKRGLMLCQGNLGELKRDLGDLAGALRLFNEALLMSKKIGDEKSQKYIEARITEIKTKLVNPNL